MSGREIKVNAHMVQKAASGFSKTGETLEAMAQGLQDMDAVFEDSKGGAAAEAKAVGRVLAECFSSGSQGLGWYAGQVDNASERFQETDASAAGQLKGL